MLPRFFGIAIAILITLHVAGEPNKGTNHENGHPQNKTPITATSNKQQNSRNAPDCTNYNSPHWYAPIKRPEWWLVIVGFLTLGVVGWQAVETHRATDAAQRSINVVASENRPWMLLEFGEREDRISTPIHTQGVPPACSFYLRNYGRTPAKLLLVKADMVIGNSAIKCPSTEIVEMGRRFIPQIIPPSESFSQMAELSKDVDDFAPVTLGTYRDGEKYLWLRGIVEYEHTISPAIGSPYRTEFCYLWVSVSSYWRLIKSSSV